MRIRSAIAGFHSRHTHHGIHGRASASSNAQRIEFGRPSIWGDEYGEDWAELQLACLQRSGATKRFAPTPPPKILNQPPYDAGSRVNLSDPTASSRNKMPARSGRITKGCPLGRLKVVLVNRLQINLRPSVDLRSIALAVACKVSWENSGKRERAAQNGDIPSLRQCMMNESCPRYFHRWSE